MPTINVKIKADGTPECTPQVTRVRPGSKLVWTGKLHHGVFEGIVPGPVRENFTLDELAQIKPETGDMPFTPKTWAILDEAPGAKNPNVIQVDPAAKSGVMYKYTVTAGGKTLDPIVIVDDNASEN
jgi:hypothetical protein